MLLVVITVALIADYYYHIAFSNMVWHLITSH